MENTDPNLSLGGAMSFTEVGTSLHALFDQVSSAETEAGSTEYRCIYLYNGHAMLELLNAVVWITSNTPSPDTTAEIGVGTSTPSGVEPAVASEVVAPEGVTFSVPASKVEALALGNIPAMQHKAVWIKRVVNAGAAAYNNDGLTIRFEGDTGA